MRLMVWNRIFLKGALSAQFCFNYTCIPWETLLSITMSTAIFMLTVRNCTLGFPNNPNALHVLIACFHIYFYALWLFYWLDFSVVTFIFVTCVYCIFLYYKGEETFSHIKALSYILRTYFFFVYRLILVVINVERVFLICTSSSSTVWL